MSAQQHRTDRPEEREQLTSDGTKWTSVRVTPIEYADDGSSELALQIERTELRARLRALERELVARERRYQDVVHRYEQVLSDRSSDDSDSSLGDRRSRLKRLLVPGR